MTYCQGAACATCSTPPPRARWPRSSPASPTASAGLTSPSEPSRAQVKICESICRISVSLRFSPSYAGLTIMTTTNIFLPQILVLFRFLQPLIIFCPLDRQFLFPSLSIEKIIKMILAFRWIFGWTFSWLIYNNENRYIYTYTLFSRAISSGVFHD